MSIAARARSCLACGAGGLFEVLDLGIQAPANRLQLTLDQDVPRYPLGLVACTRCGHSQLSHTIERELMFRDYVYRSGTSGTLRDFFEWFFLATQDLIPAGGSVLEVACNDGSLLRQFHNAGVNATGVEPAEILAAETRDQGLHVICDFFPTPELDARFDLVVGLNVLAHTPDPLGFLVGVRDVLTEDGVAILQTSQAFMLQHGEFDTIYHEHYSFFTPHSMEVLVKRAGLNLLEVGLVDIHGTSFVWVIGKGHAAPAAISRLGEGRFSVEAERLLELTGYHSSGEPSEIYGTFAELARTRMQDVVHAVDAQRAAGYRTALVGAAAKAITFARAAGLQPDAIFDEAPDKIGCFIPGLDKAIQALDDIKKVDEPTLFIISAWNFAPELERKVRARIDDPKVARFLVYFPELASW